MKTLVIAMLAIISSAFSAYASDDCNSLLSNHWAASMQDLAKLRYDLDSKIAAGESGFIVRSLQESFKIKQTEVFEKGLASGLTIEQLKSKLTAEVKNIQQASTQSAEQLIKTRAVQDAEQNVTAAHDAFDIVDAGDVLEYRTNPSLIRISDTQALIVGGLGKRATPLKSIELFDAKTQHSEKFGHLKYARENSNLLTLPDRRILVWGGRNKRNSVTQVEIIDPVAKTVVDTGFELEKGRTAFLLPNKKVLLLTYLNSFLVFDPSSGHTEKIDGLEYWGESTASQLQDGGILIVGGAKRANSPLGRALRIDPDSFAIERYDIYPSANGHELSGQAHVTLPDGQIVYSGGILEDKTISTITRFNPKTGELIEIGNLAHARALHQMLLQSDNRLVILGGSEVEDQHYIDVSSIERFDVNDGFSVVAIDPAPADHYFKSAPLDEETVIVFARLRNRSIELVKMGKPR